MRKILKDINAFAMAELLAVSIVILLIFTVLFSNYLPLVGEYETRLSYNDVTSQYAAHYIRKEYREYLENNESMFQTRLEKAGFFSIYNDSSEGQPIYDDLCPNREENCVQMIITKYILGSDDEEITAKKQYKKSDGSLFNYIQYLPDYKKSIYTGREEQREQLYRLILKTDYGYATTPILDDYYTSSDCFEGLSNEEGKLIITKYHSEKKECGEVVTIKDNSMPIKNVKGEGKVSGVITQIGNGENSIDDNPTGKGPGIKQLNIISKKFKKFAQNAFKEKITLKKIELNYENDTSSPISFGESSFEESGLESLSLPAYATYGDRAFAKNQYIQNINFNFVKNDLKGTNNNLASSLFEECKNKAGTGNSNEKIKLNNLEDNDKIKNIGKKMFFKSKIDVGLPKNVTTIGAYSYAVGNTDKDYIDNSVDFVLKIPNTVTKIDEGAFQGLKIPNLEFVKTSKLQIIRAYAFRDSGIYDTSNAYPVGVTIPASVKEIGMEAFSNESSSSKINSLNFEANSKLTEIGRGAFMNNNIKKVNLKEITNSSLTLGKLIFTNNTDLTEIVLPNTLQIIPPYMCASCTSLQSVNIPNSVTEIGEHAFHNTSQLQNIYNMSEAEKLEKIGQLAFASSGQITEFIIPKSVTEIGRKALATPGNGKVKSHSKNYQSNSNEWCDIFFGSNTCDISKTDDNNSEFTSNDGKYKKTVTYISSEEGING